MAKKKKKESNIDFGSYSDLFMVMSFVFLFMYVVSTINTGVSIIQERSQASLARKKLETTVQKYERKIETEITEEQKAEFDQLKATLAKLREDAKATREYQEKMAQLAADKEKEMMIYEEAIQQMMVDKAKSSEAIKEKEAILAKVKAESEEVIKDQERSIASLKENLELATQNLVAKNKEVEKRAQEVANIQERVNELRNKEVLAASQSKELKELTKTLSQKEQVLSEAKARLNQLQAEKSQLYKASIVQVNRIQKQSASEKAKLLEEKQTELDELMKAKEVELTKLYDEKSQLQKQTEAEKVKFAAQKQSELDAFKKSKEAELTKLKADLAKDADNLRKEIALSLAKKLKNSGLDATVNPTSGDVTVHFKNGYFDYNSSVLKDSMKEEIKTILPLYAKTLFENKKFSGAVSSVEIIGSSSPTFNGKYVNPRELASVKDQKAMTYNLDLSYRRAKGIFEYSFLGSDFNFEHKKDMVHLIKVSGTGYLQAMDELVKLDSSTQKSDKGFCGVYNCDVFQKVTLRFSLKDKQ